MCVVFSAGNYIQVVNNIFFFFQVLRSFGDGGLSRELLREFCKLKNVDDKRLSKSFFSLLFWFWGIICRN
jgi:hypothetical protein